MGGQDRTVEQRIARLAGRAHGTVARSELVGARVTERQIDGRLAKGSLIVEFPGVYRVGHGAPSAEARYMAAVKACGPGAVLSGLAAAHLLQLIKRAPSLPQVTTLTERRIEGIRTRRARRLDRRDVMTHNRIPVTTPARTLADIAADLTDDELAQACHEAGHKYRTTPRQVEAVLKRRPTSPGAAKLRRIISGDTKVSLSALERKFLQRLHEANLPLPDQTNKHAGAHRVDCRWTTHKLTVELDSYRFHNSRYAFEQDRKRERDAYARGDDFRRYTWGDVFERPRQMLAELSELLGR
jgi:hypothetical protein